MASEHDELREQAGLFVLGALTAAERAAFEAHLASCAPCAADVRALSTVAGALAYAVPQIDPPAALRARVLASVGVVPAPRRAVRPAPWLAAAASLALAVALGAYAAQLRNRINTVEARLREVTVRAEASERESVEARRAAAEAATQLAVLAAPDVARIDLTGQPAAPQAAARAFWSRSRGLVFTASNLPAPPAGRVYQLWVVTAQAPVSAGLLKPDATGRVNAVFVTPPDLPQPMAMAVTVEPDGGVPAPTGDKYLVGLAN